MSLDRHRAGLPSPSGEREREASALLHECDASLLRRPTCPARPARYCVVRAPTPTHARRRKHLQPSGGHVEHGAPSTEGHARRANHAPETKDGVLERGRHRRLSERVIRTPAQHRARERMHAVQLEQQRVEPT